MREPESIRLRRSSARLVLAALAAAALLGTVGKAAAAPPKKLLFPVVGPVQYQDDFGDPRGSRSHQGNDLMAPRRAPAIAVEAGKVVMYNGSATAGCMIYLYGKSGTTYLYIHLNNDVGKGNDNKGGCRPGISYAPGLRNGEVVRAGELIGYVGDSGDANGVGTHLHFEIHPDGGEAVSPYPYLRRATRLLFAVPKDARGRELQQQESLTLTGAVVKLTEPAPGEQPTTSGGGQSGDGTTSGSGSGASSSGGAAGNGSTAPPPPPPPSRLDRQLTPGMQLTIRVTGVTVPGVGVFKVTRTVTLSIPAEVTVEGTRKGVAALVSGASVTVTTVPIALGLRAQQAPPGALAVAALSLG